MILHELLDFFFALESSSWEFLLELRVNDGDAIAGDGNEIWQKKTKIEIYFLNSIRTSYVLIYMRIGRANTSGLISSKCGRVG